MAGGGFQESSSESKQSSRQGLQEADAAALSPTTLSSRLFANQYARQAVDSPFGYYRGERAGDVLNVDPMTGLPRSYGNFMNTAANKYLSQASAGGSMRGQNTPENTNAVAGSALTQMGMAAAPYLQDTWKYVNEFPTKMFAANLDYLNNVSQADTAAMGGQSSGSASSNAFGFTMPNISAAFAGGAGGAPAPGPYGG